MNPIGQAQVHRLPTKPTRLTYKKLRPYKQQDPQTSLTTSQSSNEK